MYTFLTCCFKLDLGFNFGFGAGSGVLGTVNDFFAPNPECVEWLREISDSSSENHKRFGSKSLSSSANSSPKNSYSNKSQLRKMYSNDFICDFMWNFICGMLSNFLEFTLLLPKPPLIQGHSLRINLILYGIHENKKRFTC